MKLPLAILLALSLVLPGPGVPASRVREPVRFTSAALPPVREGTQGSDPAFDIGVPAGDGYSPYSLSLDPARNLAYVYHSTIAGGKAVISVVDLTAARVVRLLAGPKMEYGAPGRLLIAPDGRRLFLQEVGGNTLSTIDTQTGAVKKLLDGARDMALSEDGKLLYVAGEKELAAHNVADLVAGKQRPVWRSPAAYTRLATGGDRLLAVAYATGRSMVVFDARTGTEVARAPLPADLTTFSPGPDGGWGVVSAGEHPRLIRYDAALKPLGETPIPYAANLSYDAGTNRFLAGGWRYDESEPRGHGVMLAIGGADGRIIDEVRWSNTSPPTVFAARDEDELVAFTTDGPSILHLLDRQSLAPRSDIEMGVRALEIAADRGKTLYVADDLGRIHALALPGGNEVALWQGGGPIALDQANGRLYVNRGERVVALSLVDGSVVAEFPQGGAPAPDPKRDLVYIADRGVTMYDRNGKKLGDLPSTFPDPKGFSPNPYAYAAEVNPVTGHVAVVLHNGIPGSNGGSFLRIYEPQSDKYLTPPAPHSFIMDVLADSNGQWYVAYSIARNEEAVQTLSADGTELRRLDHRTGFLALDEGRDELYLFSDGRATRLAASTLAALEVFAGPPASGSLAYSPETGAAYLVDRASSRIAVAPLANLAPLALKPAPAKIPPDAQAYGLAITASGKKRALIGQFDRTYRSADGKTWQSLLDSLDLQFTNMTAVEGGTLFATGHSAYGGEGVWRSRDGGESWEWLTGGLTDLAPLGPVLARGGGEAYFFNRGQGLLRWDAVGRTWRLASALTPDKDWSSPSLAPDGVLFRTSLGSLERSIDAGATWTTLGPIAKTGEIIGFSAPYTDTHTIFSLSRSAEAPVTTLQRSTDNGETWTSSLTSAQVNLDGYPLQLVTGFGRAYLLTQHDQDKPALLMTKDQGLTWQIAPADTAANVKFLAVDPLDGRLWLAGKGGVRSVVPDKLRWTKPAAPRPVATSTPTPAPTATVGPCATALTGGEAEINGRSLGLGCPRGPNETIQMARQKFQNGQMIWREDRRWIYVLYNDGTWGGFSDLWQEGDPVENPALTPPAGLYQPSRGFGKVWQENLGGPNGKLGWALEKEQGIQAQAQDWDYGAVLRFGGEVLALQSIGTWR